MGVPIGTPVFYLAAAATVIIAAVIAVVAVVAATVAEQKDQNDDPPPVVAAKPVADVAVITTHKNTSENFFVSGLLTFHGIPQRHFCAEKAFVNDTSFKLMLRRKKECHCEPVRRLVWQSASP